MFPYEECEWVEVVPEDLLDLSVHLPGLVKVFPATIEDTSVPDKKNTLEMRMNECFSSELLLVAASGDEVAGLEGVPLEGLDLLLVRGEGGLDLADAQVPEEDRLVHAAARQDVSEMNESELENGEFTKPELESTRV